ncbi:hypothetical protein BH11MYX3_BH11MYX3_23400 [soil metagenome]
MTRLALICFLAACSGGNNTSTSKPAPPPAKDGKPEKPAPEPAKTIPGQPCDPADACGTGFECVKYYGIAGPRGPQFSSCEVKCGEGAACPEGLKCITIADGPGAVCRP